MKLKWKIILIKNINVVYKEKAGNKMECILIGIIWKYLPNRLFKNRDFLIVDNN